MSDLAQRHCVPCEGGTPPLRLDQIAEMLVQVPDWTVEDGQLVRDIKCKNFRAALALVNRMGDLAEAEGHHPDMCIHAWNRVKVQLSTHAIGGLSDNDFILAAKIDDIVTA